MLIIFLEGLKVVFYITKTIQNNNIIMNSNFLNIKKLNFNIYFILKKMQNDNL